MRLSQQNARLNKVFVPSTFEAMIMCEELDGNLSRNSSFSMDPLVVNEEVYEHRLRSFLANQPTGEAILKILCTVITRHSKFLYCTFKT